MQSQKRKRYQKDSAPPDDIITLINLVRMNPVLYNYKLQPNQRRRADILNGWAQIAAQIGNKYTVEECRRKWKNLRDTYHQYRLRKPKLIDGGLTKWRYAKELEFLSNVYQPKLKSNRQSHQYGAGTNLLISKHDDEHEHVTNGIVHHNSTPITLDCAETFILTAYEDEGVNDDVTIDHHGSHEDPNMASMELSQDDDGVQHGLEIVKNEHASSLDDDGATGAEVDYEEVCLYEEAGNGPSVDCETIVDASSVGRTTSPDSKDFQYIDTNDFCIGSIGSARSHFSASSTSVLGSGTKLKTISLVSATSAQTINSIPITVSSSSTSGVDTNMTLTSTMENKTSTHGSSILHLQTTTTPNILCTQSTREELDLFFDFLKTKIQRFSKSEITAIQVEFLNCVLRREHAQKNDETIELTD